MENKEEKVDERPGAPENEKSDQGNESTPPPRRRSLYEEVEDSIQASVWMYLFADLREMAQKDLLTSPNAETERAIQKILQLPVSPYDISLILESNLQNLEARLGESKDFYLSAAAKWKKRNEEALAGGEIRQPGVVVDYDDEKQESECVYAITVSHSIRRIVVMFRGSVTSNDWLRNIEAVLRDIPNPVDEEGQAEYFGLHHGFVSYLYGQLDSEDRSSCDPPPHNRRRQVRRADMHNKTQRILAKVAILLEENPSYDLACIGHSLGGALASVLAAEAAASPDPRIPKPVTCVSIGSPKVGNLQFRLAIEALERQNEFRMLRVVNRWDAVPLVPDMALNCLTKSPLNSSFRHIGMKLLLHPRWRNDCRLWHPSSGGKSKFRLYSEVLSQRVKHSLRILVCTPLICLTCCKLGHSAVKAHGCLHYMECLEHYKEGLEKIYLEDLYDEYLKPKNRK